MVPGSRAAGDGYLLALDAGTGSCRAALFTLDGLFSRDGQFPRDGQPTALAQREWSHPSADGIPGSQSFDPAGNWTLICACIREVLGTVPSPTAVRAIGCSAMGGGLVLYDRGGQELWSCANGDTRAGREAAVMLADGTAAELYWRGGGWISLSAAPRLAWVRGHEPGVWADATRLSMIADWMVFRLTGTLATEASIGSTSGLFDLGRRAWSPELLNQCDLESGLFPEVVEAGTVVGQVSAAASRQAGLASGTPVVAGGLDTALGLTGPRPAVPGRLTVTGGSFWKQTVVASAPAVEPAAGCARSAMSGPASGWSRGSASTPASHSAGSGTALRRAGQRAARRATPSWRNWPRSYQPGLAASPPGWSRPMPGPGRAGSRPSRPGRTPSPPGGAGRLGWASRCGPSRRRPHTPPAAPPGWSANCSVPAPGRRSS